MTSDTKQALLLTTMGFMLGVSIASTYWLKTIPADYIRLYDKQSTVIDKCIERLQP